MTIEDRIETVESKEQKGWLGQYQLARAKSISLANIGLPDFWIKISDPATRRYGWWEKLGIKRRPEKLEDLSEVEVTALYADQKKLLAELILDWNLTHPETGESLPIPRDGLDSLELLPLGLITFLNEEVGKLFEQMGPPQPRGS